MAPRRLLSLLSTWALSLAIGCSQAPTTGQLDFGGDAPARIMGLAACSSEQGATRTIDPNRPLVVMVHGCYSSGGRFRALADVFELHGQQAVCFNYDDRASLYESAEQLRTALRGLARHMNSDQLTLLGHSQGGLIARLALSDASFEASAPDDDYRLVTVSAPFSGIRAASDCGSLPMHIASLGITLGVCQIATGSKWNEIHPKAELVRHPPTLGPNVSRHLAIMTDERDSCRRRAPSGECMKSDFVFALSEQDNPRVLEHQRVERDRVEAGHAEIVGGERIRPQKLIAALQRGGVLNPTPPEKQQALAQLLVRLF